jgi:hypothetical protein
MRRTIGARDRRRPLAVSERLSCWSSAVHMSCRPSGSPGPSSARARAGAPPTPPDPGRRRDVAIRQAPRAEREEQPIAVR